MDTNDNNYLDKQIKRKLEELEKAVENSKDFYAVNAPSGRLFDLFEMALAFDTVFLLETEFEILLAKRYRPRGWEHAIETFEQTAQSLRRKIEHWKKRELPPWKE